MSQCSVARSVMLVFCAAAACRGRGSREPDASSENAIQGLVFGYVVASDSALYGRVRGYCFALETTQGYSDPPVSVMAAFRDHSPPVWVFTSCRDALSATLARHDTVTVFVRPIRFEGSSTARVEVRYWRGSLSAARYECTLVTKRREWTLEECRLTQIS
jgi:hypothetical protein